MPVYYFRDEGPGLWLFAVHVKKGSLYDEYDMLLRRDDRAIRYVVMCLYEDFVYIREVDDQYVGEYKVHESLKMIDIDTVEKKIMDVMGFKESLEEVDDWEEWNDDKQKEQVYAILKEFGLLDFAKDRITKMYFPIDDYTTIKE